MDALEREYLRFRSSPNTNKAASLNAIRGIIRYLNKYKIHRVLELGAGGNSIAYMLAWAKKTGAIKQDFYYTGVEPNSSYRVGTDYLPSSERTTGLFGLVIVDGEGEASVIQHLGNHGMVIVEGGRRRQLEVIRNSSSRPFVETGVLALHRGSGYTVMLYEPTLSERLTFLWLRSLTLVKYHLFRNLFKR